MCTVQLVSVSQTFLKDLVCIPLTVDAVLPAVFCLPEPAQLPKQSGKHLAAATAAVELACSILLSVWPGWQ